MITAGVNVGCLSVETILHGEDQGVLGHVIGLVGDGSRIGSHRSFGEKN